MARKQTTADSEISTAPHIDAQSEIAELKAEIARLRGELAAQPVANEPGNWPEEIDYHQQPMSGARLTGISSNREAKTIHWIRVRCRIFSQRCNSICLGVSFSF